VCIIRAWQHISPAVTVKGLKKCCISNVVDGTDDNMLWNGMGMLGVSVRKVKELTVKVETEYDVLCVLSV
jgi:5-enolpyruvylshikimate-3-phosphate synthase